MGVCGSILPVLPDGGDIKGNVPGNPQRLDELLPNQAIQTQPVAAGLEIQRNVGRIDLWSIGD